MTIAKPRSQSGDKNAESSFIAGAPDAKPVRWQRGNKTQITLSISPELLEQVDAVAHRRHLSRAALLTVWINDRLEQERP
jgi:hypothetical protein